MVLSILQYLRRKNPLEHLRWSFLAIIVNNIVYVRLVSKFAPGSCSRILGTIEIKCNVALKWICELNVINEFQNEALK